MDLIAEYITAALVEKFGVPADALLPETTFEDLDVDSLVLVELAVLLERRFGVGLAEGELTADQKLTDAAELVLARSALV